MNAYNITSLAYYYKHHLSGDDGTSKFFGTYGEKTDLMISNHNKLITFWSASESRQDLSMENESAVLASNNVLLLGMHGIDLADERSLMQHYNRYIKLITMPLHHLDKLYIQL